MRKSIIFFAALGLIAGCQANSNDTASNLPGQNDNTQQLNQPNPTPSATDQDRTFVHDAAIGGMAEIQAAQMAEQQSQSDQIRRFAQQMVTDHTQANDRLTRIASQEGISIPTDLDSKHQMMMDQMSKLAGAAFDQQYVAGQVDDHQQAVALFQTEVSQGHDSQLTSFAKETLPTLQHHLKMIQEIAGSMPAANGGAQPTNNGMASPGLPPQKP